MPKKERYRTRKIWEVLCLEELTERCELVAYHGSLGYGTQDSFRHHSYLSPLSFSQKVKPPKSSLSSGVCLMISTLSPVHWSFATVHALLGVMIACYVSSSTAILGYHYFSASLLLIHDVLSLKYKIHHHSLPKTTVEMIQKLQNMVKNKQKRCFMLITI